MSLTLKDLLADRSCWTSKKIATNTYSYKEVTVATWRERIAKRIDQNIAHFVDGSLASLDKKDAVVKRHPTADEAFFIVVRVNKTILQLDPDVADAVPCPRSKAALKEQLLAIKEALQDGQYDEQLATRVASVKVAAKQRAETVAAKVARPIAA